MNVTEALAQADLAVCLDVAEAALRCAVSLPPGAALADVALTAAIQRLEALARMCQGHKLMLVQEMADREAHRGHAAASPEDLLARTLNLTPGEARAQAELAQGLRALPDTAAALQDGRIGIGQAVITVKKAEELQDRDDAAALIGRIDRAAAAAGQQMDRNRLSRELDGVVARAGVDVLAERERTAHRRRSLSITTRDGMTIVHAELDPVGGAHVRAALDALSRPDGDHDRRGYPQRQADALVAVCKRTLESTDELRSLGGTAQSVVLITNADALHGVAEAEPSLLDGHGPVSGALARQVCCDAEITHVVMRNDQVLDVQRDSRVATPRQRAAVIARDQACVGCGAPVSRCQVHHIKWWRDGGLTNLQNLVLVCWNCHTHIHHQGWQVTRDASGRYRTGPANTPHGYDPHLDNSIEKQAFSHTG